MANCAHEGHLDEVLVRQTDRGDPAAFVQLAMRWWAPAYRIAWNLLGSASLAADATERALLLAVRLAGSPEPDVPFSTSLYRAVIDVTCLGPPAARRSTAGSLDVFLPRFDSRGCLVAADDWSDLALDEIERPDLADAMRQMLQRLDGMDRAAFVLREIEQLSIEETVAVLLVSADEVRARTHRATMLMTGMLGRMLGG